MNNVFMNEKGNYRILAEGKYINNNTWETGLNNNDLIVGVSGAGKTRSYVIPNILQCNGSMIVVDTKNQLCKNYSSQLKKRGYQVWNLNFSRMEKSPMGYNPLNYLGKSSQNIDMLAKAMCPIETQKDPFWDHAAAMVLSVLISYVMEALPKEEQHLGSVARLQGLLNTTAFDFLMKEWETAHPDSYAAKKWHLFSDTKSADKTNASTNYILGEKLSSFLSPGCEKMYNNKKQIDFATMGYQKTALFINVSDSDRSADKMLNLFYTQALHELCEAADKNKSGRLQVPVRFIMDDFASNAVIADFDKIISVIRSREIYVSLVVQSLTQLTSMYGEPKAMTIINNCDSCLYLGGQDVNTANYMSVKANKTSDTILNMPVGDAWLFVRGQKPQQVNKYNVKNHELYQEIFPEKAERLDHSKEEENLDAFM